MSFGKQVEVFADKVGLKIDFVIRKLLFDGYASLLSLSPVLTGRFRASWRVSVRVPDLSVEPNRKESIQGAGSTQAATATDLAAVERLNISGETEFWITNNLPYAESLEKGSSKQNPQGILSQTFAVLQANVDRLVRAAA